MQLEANTGRSLQRQRIVERDSDDFQGKISSRHVIARKINKTIFFLLLMVIGLTAIPYGATENWWDALYQCVIFALVILWACEGLLGGIFRVNGKALLLPLLLLAAFMFFQTIPLFGTPDEAAAIENGGRRALSADSYETLRLAYKTLALALTLGLLLTYVTNLRRFRALVYLVISIGTIIAFIALGQQLLNLASTDEQVTSGTATLGVFINRNHFAFLMEMSFGLTLGLIFAGGVRRKWFVRHLAVALILLIALLTSGSSGGILSALCLLIFFALMYGTIYPVSAGEGKRSSKLITRLKVRLRGSVLLRIVLAVALLLTMLIGVALISDEPMTARFRAVSNELSVGDADATMQTQRMEIWRATIRLIKDNPLFGVGFGAFWVAITEYHNASGNFTLYQVHNDYLELLASGGLFAFLLAAWFALAVFVKVRARIKKSVDNFRRAACFGALAGIFAVAVHSFVDFGLHVTINMLIFLVLVAIAVVNVTFIQEPEFDNESPHNDTALVTT